MAVEAAIAPEPERISQVAETKLATYFIINPPGATVRVGFHGVYACLRCRSVDCEHARDVGAWDRRRQREASEIG